MSSSSIKAGEAFVEITARKGQLEKALAASKASLSKFTASVSVTGKVLAGIGGASLIAMGAMAKGFADAGGAIDDMAQRTGLSAEAVSKLAYAAKMSGSSLESVEKAITTMGKNLDAAANGGKKAQETLEALGFTVGDLESLSPDQRFVAIADSLSQIEDPGQKAAEAMKIFGKSGADLVPLLSGGRQGIGDLMKEAESLGLVMSGRDASAAAKLGDVLDQLWGTIDSVKNAIGASLAPVLTELAENFTAGIGVVRNFINDHRELVVQFARITAIVTAVGGSIVALGGIVSAAGIAFGGLASVVGLVGTAFGVMTSLIATSQAILGAITATTVGIGLALKGLTISTVATGAAFSLMASISSASTAVLGAVSGTVAFIGGALRGLALTTATVGTAFTSMAAISSASSIVMAGITGVVSSVVTALRTLVITTFSVSTAFSIMGAVIAAITSPVTLAVAAIAGLGIAIYTYSDSGMQAIGKLGGSFKELLDNAMPVFEGIKSALMSGQWAAAGQVLWTSLEIAWRTGTQTLYGLWSDFSNSIRDTWDGITTGLVMSWQNTVNWIAKKLLWVYSLFDKSIEYEKAAANMDSELQGQQQKERDAQQGRMSARDATTAANKDAFASRIQDLQKELADGLAGIKEEAAKQTEAAKQSDQSIVPGLPNLLAQLPTPAEIQTQTATATEPLKATGTSGTFSGFAAGLMGGSVSTFDRLLDETKDMKGVMEQIRDNTAEQAELEFAG